MHSLDLDALTKEQTILLNEVYRTSSISLEAFFAQLYENASKDEILMCSTHLSRNYYSNMIVQRCVLLTFVKKYIQARKEVKRVTLSDPLLDKMLRSWVSRNSINLEIVCKSRIRYYIKRVFAAGFSLCKNIANLSLRFLSRRSFCRLSGREVILLDTFFSPKFSKSKEDPYYPGLREILDSYDVNGFVKFFPTFVGFKNIYHGISLFRKKDPKGLIADDFLKFSDYWAALIGCVKIAKANVGFVEYEGIDLSRQIKIEKLFCSTNPSSCLALLYSKVPERLVQNDVKVKRYHNWYENQVQNRAINKAFRTHSGVTEVIGYQGFQFSSNESYYLKPIPVEYDCGVAPKKIYSNEGDNVAPNFRFKYVGSSISSVSEDIDLLVALPIDCTLSLEIIKTLSICSRNGDLGKVVIKLHPASKISKQCMGSWASFVSSASIGILLPRSKIVLTSASSVCLETIACAKSLIVYESLGSISRDPSNFIDDPAIRQVVYDAEDLSKAILSFKKDYEDNCLKRIDISKKTINTHFKQTSKEDVIEWLGV